MADDACSNQCCTVRAVSGRIWCVPQKVEEHQVREVLKCIIHTIVFNRALGHVSPRDMDLQLINISYVEVVDDDVERLVEQGLQRVDSFVKTLRSSAPSVRVRVRYQLLPLVLRKSLSYSVCIAHDDSTAVCPHCRLRVGSCDVAQGKSVQVHYSSKLLSTAL